MNTKFLFALTLCSACAAAPATSLETGSADQDMISVNGESLNGTSLSGNSASGTSLTGLSITSVNVAGSTGAGLPSAAASTAGPWSGAQLVGSTWNATTSSNATVKLRVDAATQGTAPNADLWFYAVSYQTSSGWSPLCGLDANNQPIQAIAVTGVWGPKAADAAAYSTSTTQFTVACRAKTIAKCVELGYKPAKGFSTQLQACVRLLRADYCGTGTPNTVDGTTLNLYDNAGVQSDSAAWLPEAEWGPAGAVCVSNKTAARYNLVSSTPPSCIQKLSNGSCGTKFTTGTLIDELPPNEVQ